MPYEITLLPNRKTRYQVINTKSGHVFSKSTTLKKAKKQVRLLRGYHKGWPRTPIRRTPTPYPRLPYTGMQTRARTRAQLLG